MQIGSRLAMKQQHLVGSELSKRSLNSANFKSKSVQQSTRNHITVDVHGKPKLHGTLTLYLHTWIAWLDVGSIAWPIYLTCAAWRWMPTCQQAFHAHSAHTPCVFFLQAMHTSTNTSTNKQTNKQSLPAIYMHT